MKEAAEKVYVVSLVRDSGMYDRCIRSNPCCEGCTFCPSDNSRNLLTVPQCYNSFLDSLPDEEDAWVVFCHEDWMPLQPLRARVLSLDKTRLWGPAGVYLKEGEKCDRSILRGRVLMSRRDGSQLLDLKGVSLRGRVDTFDCMCLAVHTSLVRRLSLRFDPALRFDMYVEDFCAAALSGGALSYALPIKSRHFSYGTRSDNFFAALEYVRAKYELKTPKRLGGTAVYEDSFGGRDAQRPPVKASHGSVFTRILRFFGL